LLFKKRSLTSFSQSVFSKFFGFEEGVDITNDVALLVRRNVVIKNIIFISNILYGVMLFILSLSSSGGVTDWVITVLAFPVTFMINQILKRLIYTDQEDKTKQSVAMYVAGFYMFFSAILIYARLYSIPHFETGAYILIYYAIVVISLYQDKQLLSSSFTTLMILLTAIHLIWTFNLQQAAQGFTIFEFIPIFLRTNDFQDIALRTLLFILFYFVVYAIVSMGQYMQQERKLELIRRRQVQSDFSHIVSDLFSVVFSESDKRMDQRHAAHIREMSLKLAKDVGLTDIKTKELEWYATIHLKFEDIKDLITKEETQTQSTYQKLKEKTELGSSIAKRLQLAQKCEDIIRAHIEGTNNENFIHNMQSIQKTEIADVILCTDMYLTLRELRSYKRPMNHSQAMKILEGDLSVYIDQRIIERFVKFQDEYDIMFKNF